MTPYEQRMLARYDLVPREIAERSRNDPLIYNTIHQWVRGDLPVERLLIQLVLFLSDHITERDNTIKQLLQRIVR